MMRLLGAESQNSKGVSPFHAALSRALARRGMRVEEVCPVDDALACRVLTEYGAMFLAADAVRVPSRAVFTSEREVANFQRAARWRAALIDGVEIELPPAALDALLRAREEAVAEGLTITPRGGPEAARRVYADTVRLWRSRCHPAIEHWCGQGRLSPDEGERLRHTDLREQVASVLALEEHGIFFSKDFKKSILHSVAAPGASQHLAMLAFDIVEFNDLRVCRVLARHGWFQTVLSDLPHFTFLGQREEELPSLGLKRTESHGQTFWIPDV
jgi:hypothetical protein